uniref:Putative 9. protein n=1 Tax=Anthurium amnicola TaxID=1678845 RepID=A0A1D1YTA9_9ARAE
MIGHLHLRWMTLQILNFANQSQFRDLNKSVALSAICWWEEYAVVCKNRARWCKPHSSWHSCSDLQFLVFILPYEGFWWKQDCQATCHALHRADVGYPQHL